MQKATATCYGAPRHARSPPLQIGVAFLLLILIGITCESSVGSRARIFVLPTLHMIGLQMDREQRFAREPGWRFGPNSVWSALTSVRIVERDDIAK